MQEGNIWKKIGAWRDNVKNHWFMEHPHKPYILRDHLQKKRENLTTNFNTSSVEFSIIFHLLYETMVDVSIDLAKTLS